jgi:hypothetical protein
MLYISCLYGVNKNDCPLFEQAFNEFIANLVSLQIKLEPNTVVNLDPGFDSEKNKKVCMLNGCIPNIKKNPRNSGTESVAPDPVIYKERFVNERAFAWEDCYRRLVIRYEVKPQNYLAFCKMAAALVLVRLL